jgi:2,3-bisphosphoglycerate-independent phosphoglycerate mutase
MRCAEKYIILVGDGMADHPIEELDGKTPLEAAETPNMDRLAEEGISGLVRTIPEKLPPGSDVASLSVLGYDPRIYYKGRAPLEAASMGVFLKDDEIGFRCNLVTVKDGRMADFSAGHIVTEEARELIEMLNKRLGSKEIRFYPGVSYRHILIISSSLIPNISTKCTPPHNITGEPISLHLPEGEGAELLQSLMERSYNILKGREYANMIWLWGEGRKMELPSLRERFGIDGCVISAIDLIKGLGVLVELEIIDVPGATGYYDTDYRAKALYGLEALKKADLLFLHVEAPDEAGHNKDLREKIRAIENFDKKTVGTILKEIPDKARILLLSDHPTPISLGRHTEDSVPFVLWGDGIERDTISFFNEKEAEKGEFIKEGHTLIERLIRL